MVAEIYIAHIYFTNASIAKVRPILLLKSNSFNDVLYMPLTSNTNTKGVVIDNSHFKNGYLPKTSVVVYEKISVIATSLLIKKIGTLKESTFHHIIDEFVRFLKQ